MKTSAKRYIFPFFGALALMLCMSSCVAWDVGWTPSPPAGWNYFYDNTLTGNWQLIQINGRNVGPGETNYLSFNGRGIGWYYYYRNGALLSEQTAYWCQDIPGGNGNTQINLQYQNGSASTMNYWFSNNDNLLWMSWRTGSGTMTYVYQYTNRIP